MTCPPSPETTALDVESPSPNLQVAGIQIASLSPGHCWLCVSPLLPHDTQSLTLSTSTPSNPLKPSQLSTCGSSYFNGR